MTMIPFFQEFLSFLKPQKYNPVNLKNVKMLIMRNHLIRTPDEICGFKTILVNGLYPPLRHQSSTPTPQYSIEYMDPKTPKDTYFTPNIRFPETK